MGVYGENPNGNEVVEISAPLLWYNNQLQVADYIVIGWYDRMSTPASDYEGGKFQI